MVSIGILSQKNEGGGPGSYNSGTGDAGGASYGTYQFATNAGTVAEFIAWLQARDDYGKDYGNKLAQFESGTEKFKEAWIELADTDEQGFGALQDEFVMPEYYKCAADHARERGIDIDNVPHAIQCVLFSNAIQHGPITAADLLADTYDPDPVLWIHNIYQTKINDPDWISGAPDQRVGLHNRWLREEVQATAILATGELPPEDTEYPEVE